RRPLSPPAALPPRPLLPAGIDANVTRPHPAGRRRVEHFKLTGLRVEREGVYGASGLTLTRLAHGVKELVRWVDRQERGARDLGGEFGLAELAGRGVELAAIDALALLTGVGADEDPVFARSGLVGDERRRSECEREPKNEAHDRSPRCSATTLREAILARDSREVNHRLRPGAFRAPGRKRLADHFLSKVSVSIVTDFWNSSRDIVPPA